MPATSEKMRRYFCTAMTVKEGQRPRSEVDARMLETVDKMSLEQLKDFCESPVEK